MNQDPRDLPSLEALRRANRDLGNMQIEYQNCLKEADALHGAHGVGG